MASVERVVRATVTTYRHPDGTLRHALRGETIEVSSEGLARWDELDGQDAAPVEPPEPEKTPVEKYAPTSDIPKPHRKGGS